MRLASIAQITCNLYARLNWQLICQFSIANLELYHIVSVV